MFAPLLLLASGSISYRGLSSSEVCSFTSIVVVDYPSLKSDDLFVLDLSPLKMLFSKAPFHNLSEHSTIADLAQSISGRCQKHLEQVTLNSSIIPPLGVARLVLPALDLQQRLYRRQVLTETVSMLSAKLEPFLDGDSYLIVVHGTESQSRSPVLIDQHASPFFCRDANARVPTLNATGDGILHRYQLLTPGLLLAALISLFVLFPILWFAISAVISIQAPKIR